MGNNPNQDHRIPERGYGMGYQESVKIESRANCGMEPDEFYRRQVGLILDEIPDSLTGESGKIEPRKLAPDFRLKDGKTLEQKAKEAEVTLLDRCGLNLGPGRKVLDLAVGQGDTSRYLASTGASVEASDYEQYLVDAGIRRDAEVRQTLSSEVVVSDARARIGQSLGKVTYSRADYGDVKAFLASAEDNQFNAITILSRSFVYLGERAIYEKALKDFYDLLLPGGKLVIQARDNMGSDKPWAKELQASMFINEEGDDVMKDEASGINFAWRWGSREVKQLSDGVEQVTASRYLQYPDGQKVELGSVTYDEHLRLKRLEIWSEMLKKAGFKNVGVKAERLTSNESVVMYAIVAEKPQL